MCFISKSIKAPIACFEFISNIQIPEISLSRTTTTATAMAATKHTFDVFILSQKFNAMMYELFNFFCLPVRSQAMENEKNKKIKLKCTCATRSGEFERIYI